MTAPAGSFVRLHVDLLATVYVGDAIVTTTGRTYLVVTTRRQARGRHRGRQHLGCLVSDTPPPGGARVHRIRWYKRAKKGTSAGGLASPRTN